MRSPSGLAWTAAAVVAVGSVLTMVLRRRRDPREKERRRRQYVNRHGRMIEGFASGCLDGLLCYTYHWRGVRYDASQDVSDFLTDGALSEYVGPLTVRFLGSKPANSIVICEEWTGIPRH